MKPFEKGDIVIIKDLNNLSGLEEGVVYTVLSCFEYYRKIYLISICGKHDFFTADCFEKVNNRKNRIENLNLD